MSSRDRRCHRERISSIHLLLPFCSSVLIVFGLLNLKHAQDRGASAWTSIILTSWACAIVFPVMVLMGGTMQPARLLYQPAAIGALFVAGQLFTFLAVHRGDVSVAAPVLGVKVLVVPGLALFVVNEAASTQVWIAAAVAMLGIWFVQTPDKAIERSKILASVGFALLAACSMSLCDVLIQRWARNWGAGYFLPIMFAFTAFYSLLLLPLADRPSYLKERGVIRPLLIGAGLMAIQAIGMTLALGMFGDATRVNIVYSLRGLWGVLITWLVARRTTHTGSTAGDRTMAMRLVGAVLIGVSVVLSVI